MNHMHDRGLGDSFPIIKGESRHIRQGSHPKNMANPFHPLEVNSHTGEPFVRLPTPLENIIVTPMRDSDKPKVIEYMNDWRIVQYLQVCPLCSLP